MTLKLAVLVSHPIQYFAPWHRELARCAGLELKVFFATDLGHQAYQDAAFGTEVQWDIPLLDGYAYAFLPRRRRARGLGFFEVDSPAVEAALSEFRPHVVQVFGYAHRCHWRARRWARRQRVPLLLVSDSSLAIRPSWWKRPLKAVVVRWFYRAVDGALAVGAQNRAYHRHYGLPEARLYSGCLPVDRARLQAAVPDRDAARALVRERHGIPKDAFVVLLCAKYVARKRPCDLVAAARAAASRGLPIWALLVGEGPLRPRLERLCRAPGAGGAVLTGFINQSTLPSYYAAADVVALPAEREPYGLAITEGGCFGLPAIVSDQVGCVGLEDAARPGVNALVHRCGDRDQLEHAIVSLAADRRRYAAMAAAAARIAAERDAAGAAAALAAAATALARLGPRRADGFGSRP